MFYMQFIKRSKKTPKMSEETAAVPQSATEAESAKPRSTRSSKSKPSETPETGSAKHRKATKPSAAAEVAAAPEAVKQENSDVTSKPAVTHEEIAALAHSYWVARGYAHGSPEQDWLRAERELQARQ